jgi:hypothetical protein
MSQAIIIQNPLPPVQVAFTEEVAQERDDLLAAALRITSVVTPEENEIASALYLRLKNFSDKVKEQRLVITRQIDAYKKMFMDREDLLVQPLSDPTKTLEKALVAWDKAEKTRLAELEAQEKARADREAEIARQRLADEQKEREENFRKRQKELDEEAAEAARLFGGPVVPQKAEVPVPVKTAPIVPVYQRTVCAPPRKSVVSAKKVRVTVIKDEAKLIAEACKDNGKIHGKQILVVNPKAVDDVMKSGITLPGVENDYQEVTGKARNAY